MQTLENELAEIHRKVSVLENEITNLTSTMRKLEKYIQEWFREDNQVTG